MWRQKAKWKMACRILILLGRDFAVAARCSMNVLLPLCKINVATAMKAGCDAGCDAGCYQHGA